MVRMKEKRFISPEDLMAIRDCYDISSSIILSPPESYEFPRDLGCWSPNSLRVWGSEGALGFPCFSNFREREGYRADRYLWRELLVCRLLKGYVRDVWGVPEWWVDRLPELVFELVARLAASQRLALMHFCEIIFRWFCSKADFLRWCRFLARLFAMVSVPSLAEAERRKERSRKRARPSAEGDNSVDPDLSTEDISELSPIEGTSPVTNHKDERRAFLLHEQVTRLWKELEVSQAEVARLQALVQEGDVRSSTVAEYLQSDTSPSAPDSC
ncbi:hypothetical protein ACLOJK_008050 [Asimina triloba]